MDHGPAVELGEDLASEKKSKLGIVLFIVYSLFYSGFVVINTISPKTMEAKVLFGLNLAVVYGFLLIIVAIVMGLVYNHICTGFEDKMNELEKEEKNP